MALMDLTGQKFGRLTVIERDNSKPKGHGKPVYWICQCECGTIKSIKACHLKNGSIKSCGCLSKELASERFSKDLTGKRFYKLTVLKRTDKTSNGSIIWLCRCDCGNLVEVSSRNLLHDNTHSCGCIISKYENIIGNILLENNIEFKTQITFPDLIGINEGFLKFDFGIYKNNELKYLIEYQGEQHYHPVEYFGGENYYNILQEHDKRKLEYCNNKNIPIIILNEKTKLIKDNIIKKEYLI